MTSKNARAPLASGYQALTEKEKQTLRLIVRGHDAKSMARHLSLSVHTVNERLRDARRKLDVTSSREAARLLLDTEGGDPQNLADKQIGEATSLNDMGEDASPDAGPSPGHRLGVVIAGVMIMSIFVGALALALSASGTNPVATAAGTPSSTIAAESAVVRSARDWLALSDQGRWKDGWLATASSFRKANTVEQWAAAARKVRVPMGAIISRTLISQESVPAPPAGVEVVKFRSSFANRADVVETVSLAREGSDWKVVGIYAD